LFNITFLLVELSCVFPVGLLHEECFKLINEMLVVMP